MQYNIVVILQQLYRGGGMVERNYYERKVKIKIN